MNINFYRDCARNARSIPFGLNFKWAILICFNFIVLLISLDEAEKCKKIFCRFSRGGSLISLYSFHWLGQIGRTNKFVFLILYEKLLLVFLNGPFLGLFFFYFRLFNTVNNVQYKRLPMTGFNPQTYGIGSDSFTI